MGAVEPSPSLQTKRPSQAAPSVAGSAERLPFADRSLAAAMAMVTVHQWSDLAAGLRELRRVASGPVVVLTFDPIALQRFWIGDYWPELLASEVRRFPSLPRIAAALGGPAAVTPVPIPIDCADGFLEAYYARPEAFLDPAVRAAQSSWTFVRPDHVRAGLVRLAADLDSGRWAERYGELRTRPTFDGSLRLLVSAGSRS